MTSATRDEGFIQFLGTCANNFFEIHQCEGENCAEARKLGGKNIRRAPALFIAPDILIDFTTYTETEMQNCHVQKGSIRNLIITHSHPDHFQPMAIGDFASDLPHPLMVYGNITINNGLDFAAMYKYDNSINNFRMTQNGSNMRTSSIVPGETFAVGNTQVTSVLANHMIDKKHLILQEQVLNFIFRRGEKTLFYGLDSSFILPQTFEILCKFQFDIVILDGTFGYLEIDPSKSGHQNFHMLEKTITQFRRSNLLKNDAIVVADHISQHHVQPYDKIVDELAERNITLAYDGMTLEFGNG